MTFIGTVYLIHFDAPYKSGKSKGVSHYVGFAVNLEGRMSHHRKGDGAKLLAAVAAAGINFDIVRKFKRVARGFERKIKNHKNTADYCPKCRKKPRTPQGYTEPKAPEKRPWKITTGADGLQSVEFTRLASTRELLTRLAKRFKVGEKLRFQDKIFERIKKKRGGEFWKLESADLVGFIKWLDESMPFGKAQFESALKIYGGELRREAIGSFSPMIQTELHESPEIFAALDLAKKAVCVCGYSKADHDKPDSGACLEYDDPADYTEIELVEKNENDVYEGFQIAPNGDELNLDANEHDRESDFPPACLYPADGY